MMEALGCDIEFAYIKRASPTQKKVVSQTEHEVCADSDLDLDSLLSKGELKT
jgi:hypothetical protein